MLGTSMTYVCLSAEGAVNIKWTKQVIVHREGADCLAEIWNKYLKCHQISPLEFLFLLTYLNWPEEYKTNGVLSCSGTTKDNHYTTWNLTWWSHLHIACA